MRVWWATSKITPMIPTSWYLWPCMVPFQTIIGLVCETKRLLICHFQGWFIKDIVALSCSLLDHSFWEMTSAMLSGDAHVKNYYSCLKKKKCMSELGSKFSSSSQAFRLTAAPVDIRLQDLPPTKSASKFLTHRNRGIRNVCRFKPLSFGAIYYMARES